MERKVIFLDRDGVLNVDYESYILKPEQIQVYPRAIRAVEKFKENGFKILVITNQPCIAKGLATEEQIDEINYRINIFYGGLIDRFYVCPHHPDWFEGKNLTNWCYSVGRDKEKYFEIVRKAKCDCRKPGIELFKKAAKEYNFELHCGIVMIGDSVNDLRAGLKAGVTPIYLRSTPRNINEFKNSEFYENIVVADDLLQIANIL